MIFIANFNNSKNLADIWELYNKYNGTNINFLLDDFDSGETNWSVPSKAKTGDIILFMCAKQARNNLGMATSHIPNDYGQVFLSFVNEQKNLYKKYSGCILGYGTVASLPEKDQNGWMADIDNLRQFNIPISIDAFRDFISISRYCSFTYLSDEQWNRLKRIINQKNLDIFSDANMPDLSVIEEEFENQVRNEAKKSIESLKKDAERKVGLPDSSNVQTKVYHRNPVIAAYVKKRAGGKCQLCGMNAPFVDKNGEPYLECHHLEWLSNGGSDTINNCVALCPNCHRKMHLINDNSDILKLKEILHSNKEV